MDCSFIEALGEVSLAEVTPFLESACTTDPGPISIVIPSEGKFVCSAVATRLI